MEATSTFISFLVRYTILILINFVADRYSRTLRLSLVVWWLVRDVSLTIFFFLETRRTKLTQKLGKSKLQLQSDAT